MVEAVYESSMQSSQIKFLIDYEVRNNHYQFKMLEQKIYGLLKFHDQQQNDQVIYSFDVTHKISLIEYVRYHSLNIEFIKELVRELIFIIKNANDYLLEEDSFYIKPEYIYVARSEDTREEDHCKSQQPSWDDRVKSKDLIYVCYFVGYHQKIREQMISIFEYLMKEIDYNNITVVQLVFTLYKVAKKESCTFLELEEVLGLNFQTDQNLLQYDKIETSDTTKKNCIPSMLEELKEEEEISSYSVVLYIKVIVSIIIVGTGIIIGCGKLGFYQNKETQEFDVLKFLGVLFVIILCNIYIGYRCFQKDNKESKMVQKIKLVDIHDVIMKNDDCKGKNQKVTQIKDKVKMDISMLGEQISQVGKQQKNLFSYDGNREQEDKELEVSSEQSEPEKQPVIHRNSQEENQTELLYQPTFMILKAQDTKYPDISFPVGEFRIGSTCEKADYVIDSKRVSRVHAEIYCGIEKIYIEDIGSTNGTYLNGVRLEVGVQYEIHENDKVKFADIEYTTCQSRKEC